MKNIESLIVKYLNRSITKQEWDELNLWFEQTEDTKTLNEYIRINYAIENIMSEFHTEKTKDSILEKIKKDKRTFVSLRVTKFLKYAVLIVIFLGIGYKYYKDLFLENSKSKPFPTEDAIALELENGTLEVLSEGENIDILNAEGEVVGIQKGNRLFYNKRLKTTSEKLVYNLLTVPYGQKFELQLSDETTVHLNAGSSLKYPIRFLKDGEREVFLVGEAFFDVTKDSKRPFIVNTSDNLDIQVFGTLFNVSNYPEDTITEVVLVTGSVAL